MIGGPSDNVLLAAPITSPSTNGFLKLATAPRILAVSLCTAAPTRPLKVITLAPGSIASI